MIKKLGLFLLLITFSLCLTGCKEEKIEGTLEDLMNKVYASIPDEEKPMMLMNTVVDSENIEYFLGTKDIELEEALASESGVGSIAHSVVLVRAKENADIEKIKNDIKENVDPRKWICVGVEKEDLIVKNKGNLIILIMVEDEKTREKIDNAFEGLK